jgi:hypothetical protein
MVPHRGDRCQFIFLCSRRLFFNVFPIPVCKAQLIGDLYENRQGAPNTIIFLIIRQYYCRPMHPAPIEIADRTRKKKLLAHRAWSSLPIGGGRHISAPIHPALIVLAHQKRNMLGFLSSRPHWDPPTP